MDGAFAAQDFDEDSRSRADLRAELARRDLPRHLALFYESRAVQLDAVAAFIEHGLATGHRCLYLMDVNAPRQIREALGDAVVDVEDRIDAGDILLRDASDIYLDAGFDPERMIGTLEDACQDSLAAGYEGLFVAGENSWCFHTEQPFDHVLDFEADFDDTCPDLPVVALCQYDLERFGEESAAKALWTHENVIYRHAVCENPFYIPPEEYRLSADARLNVKLMLEQAHSLTHARRRVRRHEQRLEVVNRVLRHNIRNDLTVVRGNLNLVDDAASLPAEADHRLDVALDHAERVLDLADRARHVQKTLGSSTLEPVDLGATIETAVDAAATVHPEAEIRVRGPRNLSVLADTNLDLALEEALTNAIVHGDRDPPAPTMTVSTPPRDVVRIEVRNPGSIPRGDRRSIQQGYETQLNHVSGLGLWLIRWITENSHGSLEFPETDDDTVTLRIELTRAHP